MRTTVDLGVAALLGGLAACSVMQSREVLARASGPGEWPAPPAAAVGAAGGEAAGVGALGARRPKGWVGDSPGAAIRPAGGVGPASGRSGEMVKGLGASTAGQPRWEAGGTGSAGLPGIDRIR